MKIEIVYSDFNKRILGKWVIPMAGNNWIISHSLHAAGVYAAVFGLWQRSIGCLLLAAGCLLISAQRSNDSHRLTHTTRGPKILILRGRRPASIVSLARKRNAVRFSRQLAVAFYRGTISVAFMWIHQNAAQQSARQSAKQAAGNQPAVSQPRGLHTPITDFLNNC